MIAWKSLCFNSYHFLISFTSLLFNIIKIIIVKIIQIKIKGTDIVRRYNIWSPENHFVSISFTSLNESSKRFLLFLFNIIKIIIVKIIQIKIKGTDIVRRYNIWSPENHFVSISFTSLNESSTYKQLNISMLVWNIFGWINIRAIINHAIGYY